MVGSNDFVKKPLGRTSMTNVHVQICPFTWRSRISFGSRMQILDHVMMSPSQRILLCPTSIARSIAVTDIAPDTPGQPFPHNVSAS